MQNLKEKWTHDKGITLVGLVITIIILLILAGIAIASLTGDNGLFARARQAREETLIAQEDELRKLTMLEAAANLENTTHTDDSTGKDVTVTIPAGFAVSQVEGENTIADGLVIIDKNGNEFVWVPVSKDNFDTQFQRRAGYWNNGVVQTLTSNYGETDSTGNNTNTSVTESATTQKEAQEMYQSVYDNEGFYIGRYETGKDINGNAVIKKGASVYNNVSWSKNNTMNEESIIEGTENNPDGAIELARNFDEKNGYTTVTSTLCYGVQWDATLSWIDPDYTGFAKDSTGMGWFSDNYQNGNATHQTGIDITGKTNSQKNIYDLAGNVFEWTMECYNNLIRISRGGKYYYSGSYYPASGRFNTGPNYSGPDIGFRVTLYVK